jgi:DNA repair exonuclease SbcCD ATPase subunit
MLQKVDSTRGLLETQNQRLEESIVENGKLNKQVEELSKSIVELQETHVKLVQEKEEQKMKFESLHAEVAKKYRQVEEKHLESLKENEKQENMIESLQAEIASLQSEKILLLQSLKEATTRSAEISKKCLKSYHRMLELENQSFGLHTELVATKLECDEVTIQLNKIKEDMKISKDSCQIQEEKESLHEKLMLQLSRNKALEEELRSTKSSLEEMKDSAFKGEKQMHDVWSELLAFAKEEDDQIIDIQSELLAMVEEKRSLIVDLQCQLSFLAAAKMFLDEENNSLRTELDRRTLVSEEEKVKLKGRLRELETTLESLNKNLESFRAIAEQKEGKIVVFQYQLLESAEEKMCLEEKNSSLITNLSKYTMASEENARLQDRIRELESVLNSLNRDPESKDIQLQKLNKHKPLQVKSLELKSGKPNCVHEGENSVNEKPKPNCAIGKRTPKQVSEKSKKIWQP